MVQRRRGALIGPPLQPGSTGRPTIFATLRSLNAPQRAAFVAAFLGWTLDAFDYFILTFVIADLAREFSASVAEVAEAITLTLAMRPLGALIFGLLGERFGRRPILMIDVLLFAGFEVATAFSTSLEMLLLLRALFGVAMGGEWGLGASLAFETVPAKARGLVSGILQQGYAVGNLLAALLYWTAYDRLGWRGMFVVGAAPALLVLYLRLKVEESPVWLASRSAERPFFRSVSTAVKGNLPVLLFMVLLMATFNAMSHGTQDLFPTFLKLQHGLGPQAVGAITVVANIGAIVGGTLFGLLSERIGRRRAIVVAAIGILPVVWIYAVASQPLALALGAFVVQFMVQGAWGIVPVHLNELAPEGTRGALPGLAYQLGNLLTARNQVFQARFAEGHRNNFGLAIAAVTGAVAILLALVAWLGPERKGVAFAAEPDHSEC